MALKKIQYLHNARKKMEVGYFQVEAEHIPGEALFGN